MEIIKHPTTIDETIVWFWQKYITGESDIQYRTTFRDEAGRYTTKKEIKAELPVARTRLVLVHSFLSGDYYIKL